jgi:hypothetical protein
MRLNRRHDSIRQPLEAWRLDGFLPDGHNLLIICSALLGRATVRIKGGKACRA